MPQPITFAVPKGRILDEALPLMARAGVVPEVAFHDKANRSLTFATAGGDMRIIRVRAFDVATFVAHGAAQAGIVGSDVIAEFDYPDLYAPVDLGIGRCRLSMASPPAADVSASRISHLRVATKYPSVTRRHFERQGIQAECVKLNGAMEIAPSSRCRRGSSSTAPRSRPTGASARWSSGSARLSPKMPRLPDAGSARYRTWFRGGICPCGE